MEQHMWFALRSKRSRRPRADARPNDRWSKLIGRGHSHHYTYGEAIQ